MLYNGDPGKSAAAQCSVSAEIDMATRTLANMLAKLDRKVHDSTSSSSSSFTLSQ